MPIGSARSTVVRARLSTVVGVGPTRSAIVRARLSAVVGVASARPAIVGACLSAVVGVGSARSAIVRARLSAVVSVSSGGSTIVRARLSVGVGVASTRSTIVCARLSVGVGVASTRSTIVCARLSVGVGVASARSTIVRARLSVGVGVASARRRGALYWCWGCVRRRRRCRCRCRCRCTRPVLSRSNGCYCEENQRCGPNRQDVLSLAAQIHKPLLRKRDAFTQPPDCDASESRFHSTRDPQCGVLDESLLGLCVPEEPDTTFGSNAISHRVPSPVKEARAGREGDNLLRSPPAGFLLCFTSHCVKDGEKPSCPFQDSASAPSLPTG
jgi:hypothetical protein